jgi:hypothetical protein
MAGIVYQKEGPAAAKILRFVKWRPHEVVLKRDPTDDRPGISRSSLTFGRQTPNAKRQTPNAERRTPNAERQTLRSSQITSGPRIDPDGFALFDKERDLD